ncbi:MAG: calcium-binding protein, partial [Planctomycetota bacterium]
MRISPWLRSLFRRPTAKRRPHSRQLVRNREQVWESGESLEQRVLLTGTATVNNGTLTISLPNDEDVRVTRQGADVRVEFGENGMFEDDMNIGSVAATSISSIVVIGGDGNNDINLSLVTSATFQSLTSVDITGDDGDDFIRAPTNVGSLIDAGDGTDTVQGSSGDDTIAAGNGADSVDGQGGNDSIDGSDGNDTISGGAGLDTISGGNGTDSLLGGNDNDSITGGSSNDTILGENGDDVISSGSGDDSVNGGIG